MWQISDAARAALVTQSQTYVARADLLSPAGAVLATLNATGGDVQVDATASVRRTCSVTLADPDGGLVPRVVGDLLDPRTGNEIRIYRGIVIPRVGTEWVPLITARLTNPDLGEDVSGVSVKVTGNDRARAVQRAVWIDRYMITYGTNLGSALAAMLHDRVPSLPVTTALTTQTTTWRYYGLGTQGDPWADAVDLATQGGWRLVVDPMGTAYAGPVPDPAAAPVAWDYAEGTDCTVTSYGRTLSEDETYSGVIATAESISSGTSLTSIVWDTDPNSPTYYLGPFGKHPKAIELTGVDTQTDADNAAAAALRDLTGLAEQVTITAAPNPALDADDVIRVTRTTLGIDADYVIQQVTQPIGPGLMSLTCRTRRF